jgi:hypothetical protein
VERSAPWARRQIEKLLSWPVHESACSSWSRHELSTIRQRQRLTNAMGSICLSISWFNSGQLGFEYIWERKNHGAYPSSLSSNIRLSLTSLVCISQSIWTRSVFHYLRERRSTLETADRMGVPSSGIHRLLSERTSRRTTACFYRCIRWWRASRSYNHKNWESKTELGDYSSWQEGGTVECFLRLFWCCFGNCADCSCRCAYVYYSVRERVRKVGDNGCKGEGTSCSKPLMS